MMRTAEFSDFTGNSFDRITGSRARNTVKDIRTYFEDMLLDDDFDRIGSLENESDEYEIYRELSALPKGQA
jgi:hypothetical protein